MNEVKSIALWCDVDDHVLDELKKKMLLHVNYWHFPCEKETKSSRPKNKKNTETNPKEVPDILDIGFMVPSLTGLKQLSVYLPFDISFDDIEDISPLLNGKNVAGAIFNEALTVQEDSETDNFKLTLSGGDENFCRVRPFHQDATKLNDPSLQLKEVSGKGVTLSIVENNHGTIFSSEDKKTSTYFRLRISLKGKNKKAFVKSIKPEDSAFNSGYETTEFIDFRINESRLLPKQVVEPIIAQQVKTFIPVKRIDFLLAVNLEADITGARKEFHKSRFLEPDTWKLYFEGKSDFISEHLKEGMLVYHWKKVRSEEPSGVENLDDFIAFVRLKIRISNGKTKNEFIKTAFFIGLLGSLVGSVIFSTISWGLNFFGWGSDVNENVTIVEKCENNEPLIGNRATDNNLKKDLLNRPLAKSSGSSSESETDMKAVQKEK